MQGLAAVGQVPRGNKNFYRFTTHDATPQRLGIWMKAACCHRRLRFGLQLSYPGFAGLSINPLTGLSSSPDLPAGAAGEPDPEWGASDPPRWTSILYIVLLLPQILPGGFSEKLLSAIFLTSLSLRRRQNVRCKLVLCLHSYRYSSRRNPKRYVRHQNSVTQLTQTGYDEGGFSASTGLPSFVNDFGLKASLWKHNPTGLADRKANISSFGVLGAAFGAIIALALTDRLGRLRCWQLFVGWWATGILMQVFSSGIYGFMLFARIWGGLGAGGLTVVAPLYLSEVAPARSRGMVVSIYMVLLLSFLSLGKSHASVGYSTADTAIRVLHQLCCQCDNGSDGTTIPARASHPSHPNRYRIHLLLFSVRHSTLARLKGSRR